VAAAYDLWSENDLLGQQSQEARLAMSFQPNFFLIPDLRLAASKDLLDEDGGNYGFAMGLTLLSLLSIDAGVDLDLNKLSATEEEQIDAIRGAGFTVGLDLQF
jgi:hypothetical protein